MDKEKSEQKRIFDEQAEGVVMTAWLRLIDSPILPPPKKSVICCEIAFYIKIKFFSIDFFPSCIIPG